MNAEILATFFKHLNKTAMMETAQGSIQEASTPLSGQAGPRINPMIAINTSAALPGQNGNEKGPIPVTTPGKPIKFNNNKV